MITVQLYKGEAVFNQKTQMRTPGEERFSRDEKWAFETDTLGDLLLFEDGSQTSILMPRSRIAPKGSGFVVVPGDAVRVRTMPVDRGAPLGVRARMIGGEYEVKATTVDAVLLRHADVDVWVPRAEVILVRHDGAHIAKLPMTAVLMDFLCTVVEGPKGTPRQSFATRAGTPKEAAEQIAMRLDNVFPGAQLKIEVKQTNDCGQFDVELSMSAAAVKCAKDAEA